jgi:predicted TIM-barrel fold metal-dependent hydrolase
MMIIDTETHVIYRKFLKEANPEKSLIDPATWHELNGDLLVAEMDRAKVDHAFLISYGTNDLGLYLRRLQMDPEDLISGKKYAKYFFRKYPDRFYWFSTLPDPRRKDTLTIVEEDFRGGATGVKIFPALINMNLNDTPVMRVLDLVRKNNGLVMLGLEETAPPETPSLHDLLRQLDEEVLEKFPDLRFQLNHAGCIDPLLPDAQIVFDLARKHENLFLSTALLGYCYDDEHEYPFPNQLNRLHRLYDEVGAERLMFGTDWPWVERYRKYVQDVDAIRRHCPFMKEEEKEKFLGLNALKFLGKNPL